MTIEECAKNFREWLTILINLEHPKKFNEETQKYEYPPQYIIPYFAFENTESEIFKNQTTGEISKSKTPSVKDNFTKICFTRSPVIIPITSSFTTRNIEINGITKSEFSQEAQATFTIYEIGSYPTNLARIKNILKSGFVNELEDRLNIKSIESQNEILSTPSENETNEYQPEFSLELSFNFVLTYLIGTEFIKNVLDTSGTVE